MSETRFATDSVAVAVVDYGDGLVVDTPGRRYSRLVSVPCRRYGHFAVARSPIGTRAGELVFGESWSVVHAPTAMRLAGGLSVQAAHDVVRSLVESGLAWSSPDPATYLGDPRYREAVDDLEVIWF